MGKPEGSKICLRIPKISSSGKKFTVSKKYEHADNYRHNKKVKLTAVIRFESQKCLYDIIAIMIRHSKDRHDTNC
jgi:ribosomal protein L13